LKKNIWYISKYAVSKSFGNPTRQYRLCKYLSRMGYNISLISSYSVPKINDVVFDHYFIETNEEGFRQFLLRGPKIGQGFSIKRIWSWILFEFFVLRLFLFSKKFQRPDVIIVSSLSIMTFLTGVLLKFKYRSKLILEVRDIWPLTLVELGGFSKWNPFVLFLSFIEKFGYRNANAIVGTMPGLSRHVANVMGKELPVCHIPQGFDPEILQVPKLSESSQKLIDALEQDYFNVVYAGTIGKANSLNIIFDAARILNTKEKVRFYFIGEGSLKQYYIDAFGSLKNVYFVPHIVNSELRIVLHSFDLLLYPVSALPIYSYGVSANKLIDYGLSGVPILTSPPGFSSMFESEKYAFLENTNKGTGWAESILRISKINPDKLKLMGDLAVEISKTNLSFVHLAEKYSKLISE
jgi:hypothetical protein